ncbi:hypothetical protein ACFY12_34335 [Streptomyces sp. NPDC001339]|uniref:hypothetical protein n=1 Tax=Streptomyces sp. NPDC001339 TaxID=3364563 RepID=UPI0036B67A58
MRDLIQRMRDLKEAAGNPSLAEIEKAISFARPTIGTVFTGPELSSREVTVAVAGYLGGDAEDVEDEWVAARAWVDARRRWASENPLLASWPKDEAGLPQPPQLRQTVKGLNEKPAGRATSNPVRDRILEMQAEIDQYLRAVVQACGLDPAMEPRDVFHRFAEDAAFPADIYRFRRLASMIDDFGAVTTSLLHDLKAKRIAVLAMVFQSYLSLSEHFVEAMDSNLRDLVESRALRERQVRLGVRSVMRGEPRLKAKRFEDYLASLMLTRHPAARPSLPADEQQAADQTFEALVDNHGIVLQWNNQRLYQLKAEIEAEEANGASRQEAEDVVRGRMDDLVRRRAFQPDLLRAETTSLDDGHDFVRHFVEATNFDDLATDPAPPPPPGVRDVNFDLSSLGLWRATVPGPEGQEEIIQDPSLITAWGRALQAAERLWSDEEPPLRYTYRDQSGIVLLAAIFDEAKRGVLERWERESNA